MRSDLTFSGRTVGQWLLAFEELGLDAARLCASSGIAREGLDTSESRVSVDRVSLLWRAAEEHWPDESLGLEVARHLIRGRRHVVLELHMTGPSLGSVLEDLVRHQRIISNAMEMRLEETPGHAVLRFRLLCGDLPLPDSMEDLAAASLVEFCAAATSEAFRPIRVELSHSRPADTAHYRRAFGAETRFEAEESGIWIPATALELASAYAHPDARRMHDQHVRARLDRIEDSSTVAGLKGVLVGLLPELADVARASRLMGVSGRTLQRRLSEEGFSFRRVLDDVRREAVFTYLDHSSFTIAEIAARTGFRSVAGFYKAFQRWSDLTPQQRRDASETERNSGWQSTAGTDSS